MREKNFDYKCYEALPYKGLFNSRNGKRLTLLIKKGGVKRVVGRKILETCRYLGSYGMGGPGFFGFRLEKKGRYPEEWMVLTTWSADQWLLLDGKWLDCNSKYFSLEKCYFTENKSMFSEAAKQVSEVFDGLTIAEFKLYNQSFYMILQDGDRIHKLEFPSDLTRLPPYGGGGNRGWCKGEKLSDGLIISFTQFINI
jgi:hypothetical protein